MLIAAAHTRFRSRRGGSGRRVRGRRMRGTCSGERASGHRRRRQTVPLWMGTSVPVLARPLPTGATEERARVRRGWEHKARSRRNHETGLSGWQTKRRSTRNSSAPNASQPKQIPSLEFDKSSKGRELRASENPLDAEPVGLPFTPLVRHAWDRWHFKGLKLLSFVTCF